MRQTESMELLVMTKIDLGTCEQFLCIIFLLLIMLKILTLGATLLAAIILHFSKHSKHGKMLNAMAESGHSVGKISYLLQHCR